MTEPEALIAQLRAVHDKLEAMWEIMDDVFPDDKYTKDLKATLEANDAIITRLEMAGISQVVSSREGFGCARCGESFDRHCRIDHPCEGYKTAKSEMTF